MKLFHIIQTGTYLAQMCRYSKNKISFCNFKTQRFMPFKWIGTCVFTVPKSEMWDSSKPFLNLSKRSKYYIFQFYGSMSLKSCFEDSFLLWLGKKSPRRRRHKIDCLTRKLDTSGIEEKECSDFLWSQRAMVFHSLSITHTNKHTRLSAKKNKKNPKRPNLAINSMKHAQSSKKYKRPNFFQKLV